MNNEKKKENLLIPLFLYGQTSPQFKQGFRVAINNIKNVIENKKEVMKIIELTEILNNWLKVNRYTK